MTSEMSIEALSSEEKRAALSQLLKNKLNKARAYPLSSGQQGIWFQQQLDPQSPAYNIPLVFCISGDVDVDALRRSLDFIVQRHHVLRTLFTSDSGAPMQQVQPESGAELSVKDLEGIREDDWKAQVLRLSHEQSRRPMDLVQGPLFRFELLNLSSTLHALLITIHHIVLDGWSIGLLQKEFTLVYLAFVNGEPSPLAPLKAQYYDFIQWEQRKLTSGTIDTQVAYWKRRLQRMTPAFEVPGDLPRPAVQTFEGASRSFIIPAALADELKAIGHASGATLFMTLLASFYVWLFRLSGEDDIVVGTSVANRDREEFRELIGLFANTVPMRADLSGDPTFIEFVERVRENALEDYGHTDVPLAKLVEELNPLRDTSRNVLFQVAFDFQNTPWLSVTGKQGDAIALLNGDNGAAKLDLNLSVSRQEQDLVGLLEYSKDLFTETTICRIISVYESLLNSIVDQPGKRLSELQMFNSEERRHLVEHWNRTSHPFPGDVCIHDLIERQARGAPDSEALADGDRRWSYRELATYSDRLAKKLQGAGVGPESRVGICSERSLEQIGGVLAILKSGGCYVPLDPALPPERLAYMIEDARVSVLLTTRNRAEAWDGPQVRIVHLEPDESDDGHEVGEPLVRASGSGNLAYVIYTSGSTGNPKGVMVSHRSVLNHAFFAASEFAIEPADRMLQFASLNFDASAEEIFPCLLNGATLVLRTNEMLRSPATFLESCRDWGITILDLPTAYWHELVRAMDEEQLAAPPSLRLVIIGGEAASPELAGKWREMVGSRVRLVNTYGPTEATIVATFCDLSSVAESGPLGHGVPIGKPIQNVKAYVLDANLEPVPVGLFGEILLGGVGLARGYLDRPELTAEKFTPDPFSVEPGARLYRTGDIGRRLASGDLEFKSRSDRQVKLRGFRIELGELEAVLKQHPAVAQAEAVLSGGYSGHRRLQCFVVCHVESGAGPSELLTWMRQRLPEYMVPAALITLGALPKTVTGKVDRQALLALCSESLEGTQLATAPRTPSEEILVGIWADVLRVPRVGVHDNFFELGGHSLLATQVVSRIRRVMKVDMPLHSMFEAPTIARFVQLMEANRWSQQGMAPPPMVRLLRDAESKQVFTQSFAQQRLWFLDRLEPNTAAYNIPIAVALAGELDVKALEQSLNEIVRRHEVLRTTFDEAAEQPVQVIASELTISVAVTDLSRIVREEQHAAVSGLLDEAANRPFGLARGPLLRMEVFRLGEQEHVLLFTMHHIVSDAWSMGIVVGELAVLYPAFHSREPSPLPDLDLQYADFAQWQREWLSAERLNQQIDYWRTRIAGAPVALQLPNGRRQTGSGAQPGAKLFRTLSRELTESINAFSRSENVTPFMTLLAGFEAVIYRYTGQVDFIVGTPIANRYRQEIEPLIGFFVNTLAMRADLSGQPTFRDLVGRVRETALGAYAHQDLPFERLVEELGPERKSGSPLFRIMFVLQNAPMPALELPGLTLSPFPLQSRTTKFDMTMEIVEHPAGFVVNVEYNTNLFSQNMVERVLEHYQNLLEKAVKNAASPLSSIPMVGEAERLDLLSQGNQNEQLEPMGVCLHTWFEQQVAKTPEAVAVEFGDQALTYAELNRRANQLAHYLLKLGAGPEARIGICVERSLHMVVGLLGILKAGGAYVPLDPAYPSERLTYMVEDAQVLALLTQEGVQRQVSFSDEDRVIRLDAQWNRIAGESDINPEIPVNSENLAYVIYTSGSTGKPKGVGIRHGSAATLLRWAQSVFTEEETAGVLACTSICFDLSVFELFVPLSRGGRVVLVKNALDLGAFVETEKVTLVNTVPSAMTELLRMNAVPSSVRVVNLAGEALSPGLAKQVYERKTIERLFNLYGPSEDTTYSTCAWLKREEEPSDVSIGRAISNTQAYVLDARDEPVPVGVAGELYLGGDGLARGYINRPELTAEKFVPNPFSKAGGERLYRTGDLVRWREDGNLDFLGRMDHQVKLRGYRIELGEIENALCEQKSVQRAVLLVREDHAGDKKLVAYIEREPGDQVSSAQLKDALKQKLPDYMVPGAFVFLDSFPQTLNGKVNRAALPAPEAQGSQREYIAPRTAVEESLSEIWADVLNIERVSVDDNFFELGGHSLLATRVVSRVRKVLGLELPLHSLFEEPTIEALAHGIETRRWQDNNLLPPNLIPIPRDTSVTRVLPQAFAQSQLWFLEQLEPGRATYNNANAVRLAGVLNLVALEESLKEIIRRHESLRTTFLILDEQPVQIISPELAWNLDVIHLEELAAEEREVRAQQILDEDARRLFDLTVGPVVRAAIIVLSEREHILLFNIHHIVADGWSFGVFVRELSALYKAFEAGQPSPLPPLVLSAPDFYIRQEEWLAQGAMEMQLSYWQARLAGASPVLDLPLDHPRPLLLSGRGATVFTVLPPALADSLKLLSRREGTTLFMVLLAAFKTLLARYSGQFDVVIGSPIANRHWEESEPLIAFLTNAVSMRTDLSGDPTFRELLTRVRETALGAYANQDVAFSKVVHRLGAERVGGRTPIFQVMFVLQNAPMPPLDLPGLTPSAVAVANETAMLELTLEVVEHSYGTVAALQYSTELFEESTILRMLEHYEVLLEGIVQTPAKRLSELPLLRPAEFEQVVNLWNANSCPGTPHESIHALFEAQVRRTPDLTAVVSGNEELSYLGLDRRANQLAQYLISLGVGPESRVGLWMSRSPLTIVAMLAILKAGAAYVPIDPAYPVERVSFMLDDSDIGVLLTEQALCDRLPGTPRHTVLMDEDASAIASYSSEQPTQKINSNNLAYVIYTSGSTGKPKGVMIEHRSCTAFIGWAHGFYQAEELRSVLASTSLSFDVSVVEILVPLTCGGKVVLIANALDLTPRHQVTTVGTVPSAMVELLRSGLLPADVDTLNLAGEYLPASLAQSMRKEFPKARILNLYGPSEDTTYSTVYELSVEESMERAPYIGRPIAGTQAYVLNEAMQPTPIGVPGEIYLAGAGLARGYLQRPDLTAEKFLPCPFASSPGERMYQTGDRGLFHPDGNLEYLGRNDNQVKIRGYRIEPGEIEAALECHPAIQQAVVLAVGNMSTEKRLVAYFTQKSESAGSSAGLSASDLREYLRRTFPDYMVPTSFMPVAAMPLTGNGKIDRKALAIAEPTQAPLTHAFIAPQTAAENAIAHIWSGLLNVTEIGVTDDFFELGGHSLIATQIVSRLRQFLQIEVSLRDLFSAPTIQKLVKVLGTSAGGSDVLEETAATYLQIAQMSEDEVAQLLSEQQYAVEESLAKS